MRRALVPLLLAMLVLPAVAQARAIHGTTHSGGGSRDAATAAPLTPYSGLWYGQSSQKVYVGFDIADGYVQPSQKSGTLITYDQACKTNGKNNGTVRGYYSVQGWLSSADDFRLSNYQSTSRFNEAGTSNWWIHDKTTMYFRVSGSDLQGYFVMQSVVVTGSGAYVATCTTPVITYNISALRPGMLSNSGKADRTADVHVRIRCGSEYYDCVGYSSPDCSTTHDYRRGYVSWLCTSEDLEKLRNVVIGPAPDPGRAKVASSVLPQWLECGIGVELDPFGTFIRGEKSCAPGQPPS